MDDLVEQLKNRIYYDEWDDLCREAAEEIERLRYQNKDLTLAIKWINSRLKDNENHAGLYNDVETLRGIRYEIDELKLGGYKIG